MELFIYDKMKRYIAFKSTWLGRYTSIRMEWTEHDHRFFFGQVEPILIESDQEMIDLLFPFAEKLPFKAVGRRSSKRAPLTKIQVCAKALVKRTPKCTTIFFDYSQFNCSAEDGQWTRAWPRPFVLSGRPTVALRIKSRKKNFFIKRNRLVGTSEIFFHYSTDGA
jgi:hypothetical protein